MDLLASLRTLTLAQAEGSSLSSVFSHVPRDPAAIFVYFLIAASGFLIWKGSRKKGEGKP